MVSKPEHVALYAPHCPLVVYGSFFVIILAPPPLITDLVMGKDNSSTDQDGESRGHVKQVKGKL